MCIGSGPRFEGSLADIETAGVRRIGQNSRTILMPERGLEPLRIAPPDPKSGASANFATPA